MTFEGIYKSAWFDDGQILVEIKGNNIHLSNYDKGQTEYQRLSRTKYSKKNGVEYLEEMRT